MAVDKDKELLRWADLSFDLTIEEGESIEQFRDRFAQHMLDQDEPFVAAEIILGKGLVEWSPLECAKFVLDYEEWFDGRPSNHYGAWSHLKDKHKEAINQIIFMERRRQGEVTSNTVEVMTLDGRHAAEVGKWDESRQGRHTHWDRSILKEPPHGYEEAIRKREAFPVDSPDQGHLLIRHFDKDGKGSVKQIVPKKEPLPFPALPATPSKDGEG
jgi:hypothetical protein